MSKKVSVSFYRLLQILAKHEVVGGAKIGMPTTMEELEKYNDFEIFIDENDDCYENSKLIIQFK